MPFIARHSNIWRRTGVIYLFAAITLRAGYATSSATTFFDRNDARRPPSSFRISTGVFPNHFTDTSHRIITLKQ
jgi:hypothetical protein